MKRVWLTTPSFTGVKTRAKVDDAYKAELAAINRRRRSAACTEDDLVQLDARKARILARREPIPWGKLRK